jgi:hypothetical protein
MLRSLPLLSRGDPFVSRVPGGLQGKTRFASCHWAAVDFGGGLWSSGTVVPRAQPRTLKGQWVGRNWKYGKLKGKTSCHARYLLLHRGEEISGAGRIRKSDLLSKNGRR